MTLALRRSTLRMIVFELSHDLHSRFSISYRATPLVLVPMCKICAVVRLAHADVLFADWMTYLLYLYMVCIDLHATFVRQAASDVSTSDMVDRGRM